MTAATEHMEALRHHLADAEAHASMLARMVGRGTFADRSAPGVRSRLAEALRQACDAAADVGCEQLDIRWTDVVTLISHANEFVWPKDLSAKPQLIEAEGYRQIAQLMARLMVRVQTLRHRAIGREVTVRLR